jgi:hypothetical protein
VTLSIKMEFPMKTAALIALAMFHATAALAQGTWVTTLLPRDLDGDLTNGPEAFYDTTLDITWISDWRLTITMGATRDGRMTWADANAWASGATYGGYDDWRLPSVSGTYCQAANCTNGEIGHLWYLTLGNSNQSRNMGPFSNIPNDAFWTQTPYTAGLAFAFSFNGFGSQFTSSLGNSHAVMLVRNGDTPAVPEAASLLMLLAGLAVVGTAANRGRRSAA